MTHRTGDSSAESKYKRGLLEKEKKSNCVGEKTEKRQSQGKSHPRET